jgi:hypothetical protein
VCLGFLEWLCGSSYLMLLGILNLVYNVFCHKKSICCIMGASEVLGLRGYWGVELIVRVVLALNLCLVSETEPC